MFLLQEAIAGGIMLLAMIGIGLFVLLLVIAIYIMGRQKKSDGKSLPGTPEQSEGRKSVSLPLVITIIILLVLLIVFIKWCNNFRYD